MTQTALTIANVSHTDYRAQDNARAQALASCMSGPTAPASPVGGMLWLDTGVSPAVLRQRNAANSAWGPLLLVFADDTTPDDDETLPVNRKMLIESGAAADQAIADMAAGAVGSPRLSAGAHPTFAAGDVELLNVLGADVVGDVIASSSGSSSGTNWRDVFSFHPINAGDLRVTVDLRQVNGTNSQLRILKNGAPLGSALVNTSTAWASYSADFSYAVGDLITLQAGLSYTIGSGGGSRSSEFKNLRIRADQRGVFRI